MNRILLFCALGALWGCRTVTEPTTEAITLSCSTSESSKVGALTAGDEVAVFARLDGTENYFLEAEKFITGSDGTTLSRMPAVHYPEPKQAVEFFAYFPYHTGTFSVPSDQSTAAALKQADLCWATASTTPVATPVSLTFQHLFARLIVQTNQTPSKIACQVVPSGVLNAATAQFTLTGGKREVFTTGSELILPVQSLSRLVLTVAGVEYVYDGAISLLAGQTTTLNLTLNPATKTATLNGSSTTKWNAGSVAGDPDAQVNNAFTIHYAPAPTDYAKADKVTLTVQHPVSLATQDIDLTPTLIAGQSSAKACGYTFALQLPVASGVPYPYMVNRVRLYSGATVLRDTPQKYLKGSLVYRSGAQTLAHYITIAVRDEVTNTIELKNWVGVMGGGEQRLVKVTVEGADTWTAVPTGTGLGATASGANGAVGAIYWERNPSTAAGRSGSLTFSTVPSGASVTIPTNQLAQATPPGTIMVNGVAVCTGNLVADGPNGCKIGAPTDYGLYFKFGSLIGWSGGANGDGRGAGSPEINLVVKPIGYNGDLSWINSSYYTGALVAGIWQSINNYPDGSNNPVSGVGDPCSYYLGTPYRVPTRGDAVQLYGNSDGVYKNGWSYSWSPRSAINGSAMLITAGFRYGDDARLVDVNYTGSYQLAANYGVASSRTLVFYPGKFYSEGGNAQKYYGHSVRCVAN